MSLLPPLWQPSMTNTLRLLVEHPDGRQAAKPFSIHLRVVFRGKMPMAMIWMKALFLHWQTVFTRREVRLWVTVEFPGAQSDKDEEGGIVSDDTLHCLDQRFSLRPLTSKAL